MILLIEDDKDTRDKLHLRLYRAGVNAVASSTRYAIDHAKKQSVHVAYYPHPTPSAGPLHFCQKFKDACPGIPLAVAFPKETPERILNAFYYAADHVIFRPLSTIRLLEILFELARLECGRDFTEIEIGPTLVSIHSDCLYLRKQPVAASLIHRLIIRYLAEEYPRPVPDRELALYAGNPMTHRSSRAVRQHIANLNRAALRLIGWMPIIEAEPGAFSLLRYQPSN